MARPGIFRMPSARKRQRRRHLVGWRLGRPRASRQSQDLFTCQSSVSCVSKLLLLLNLKLSFLQGLEFACSWILKGSEHTRALMLLLATPRLPVDDVRELVPFDSRDLRGRHIRLVVSDVEFLCVVVGYFM